MRLYLAGPMSGIPQFNFPAFQQATRVLRGEGFEVVAPHEEDPEDVQKIAWDSPDGDPSFLPTHDGPLATTLRNVHGVHRCHGVALLDGWQKSSGARHEIATADRFHLPVAPWQLWSFAGPDAAEMMFGVSDDS